MKFIISIIFALYAVSGAQAIFGGRKSEPNQFPSLVSLRVISSEPWNSTHFCGATIINKKWLLTSASCFVRGYDRSEIGVFLGAEVHHIRGRDEPYNVEKIVYYPGVLLENDIALVQTTEPIVFSEKIQPIQIYGNWIEQNANVITAGWGAVDVSIKLTH